MKILTTRGYDFFECSSAMQKAIRRGDARLGGYWAVELHESNYGEYVWNRLMTISAEDCWGILTQEVESLYRGWLMVNKRRRPKDPFKGRVFVAKAVILLSQAKKSRDADHLTNLLYDAQAVTDHELDRELTAARKNPEEIPEYAFDVHTQKGKKRGRTKEEFFADEHAALKPREPGLFDKLIDS